MTRDERIKELKKHTESYKRDITLCKNHNDSYTRKYFQNRLNKAQQELAELEREKAV